MKWMDELMLEDLPESYREICTIVGIENTIRLSECLGGLPFYLPKLDRLVSKKKEQFIRKHFNGSNHRELARITEYSERWVYEILRKKCKAAKPDHAK